MSHMLTRSLLTLTLVLAVGCATAPPPKPVETVAKPPPSVEKSPEELFQQGLADADAGRLDDALAAFQKAIVKSPRMVNAQFNIGLVLERQGNLTQAVEAYEAALALDSSHMPTLLNLGRLYRVQAKFDRAVTLYEEAVKVAGREYDVQLLNNLTVAYRLAKAFDKAEATAKKVLARTKDNADAYKNLALVYYDQGNYRLAEFISANARKLDNKDPGVYNNLGMIYLKLNQRGEALAQFQKAVALNDRFAPGHLNIGAMALTYRDYDLAEKEFAKAVSLDPNSPDAHLDYAFALDGQRGRDPKKGMAAGGEFERALALRPDLPEAVCGAGWAYTADRSGWDKAMGFLEKCKTQPAVGPADRQLIDAKLQTLAALQKSGAPAPQAPKKESPKPTGGAQLLDKATEDAAKQEGDAPAPPPDAAQQNPSPGAPAPSK
jgi:tetratricopeptide (TPR) repeat protein